jgi:hypothetical protein
LFLRRSRLQVYLVYACFAAAVIFIVSLILRGSAHADGLLSTTSNNDAPVVIVTVLDDGARATYVKEVQKNREDYAQKHGTECPQHFVIAFSSFVSRALF